MEKLSVCDAMGFGSERNPLRASKRAVAVTWGLEDLLS